LNGEAMEERHSWWGTPGGGLAIKRKRGAGAGGEVKGESDEENNESLEGGPHGHMGTSRIRMATT